MDTLTMANAHLFIEDFNGPIAREVIDPWTCEHCHVQLVIVDEAFRSCPSCGETDLGDPTHYVVDQPYSDTPYYSKKSLYKRRLYCNERLALLSCHKLNHSQPFKDMVKTLKHGEVVFEGLQELRELMKVSGYQKFYKYIYSLYRDLTGEQLITMNSQQMDQVSRRVVNIDVKFKEHAKVLHWRKNIISYSSLIYLTMESLGIPGYEYVLLPKNHLDMEALYDQLVKGCKF